MWPDKMPPMQVGELYRNDPTFDVHRLVAELVEDESVPLLPVLRYKDSGLCKRRMGTDLTCSGGRRH